MGRIEYSKGEFWMYKEGMTPSVRKVIYAMDAERSALFTALGYQVYSYDQIMADCMQGVTMGEFAVASSKGPFSMQDRYVTEDIHMGVTLTASLARQAGIPTPTYDSMIHIASVVNDTDYYATGRNLENLGLAHLTLPELEAYVQTGHRS
jgi:opine dehydrogenase